MTSEPRNKLGLAALALLPSVCCVGLPLLAAAGVSVVLVAWVGGVALGAIALGVAAVVLAAKRRGRRAFQMAQIRSRA